MIEQKNGMKVKEHIKTKIQAKKLQ